MSPVRIQAKPRAGTAGYKPGPPGKAFGFGGVNVQPPVAKPVAGPGEVAFAATNPAISVRCKLGAESATPAGGVGGWNSVDRPGREAGIEWAGLPAATLTIPILLDGLADRRSVESEIAAFYVLGAPLKGSPRGTTPPVLKVAGMVPHRGREWVLTGFDEGAAIWDGTKRIRLWATVTLTAYEPLDVIKITPKKKGTTATRIHVVKRGETLGGIARDLMGAKTATAIAKGIATLKKLNGIRDPKALKVGQRLKVPR